MNNKKAKKLRRSLGLSGRSKNSWTNEEKQLYHRVKDNVRTAQGEKDFLDSLARVSRLLAEQGINQQ